MKRHALDSGPADEAQILIDRIHGLRIAASVPAAEIAGDAGDHRSIRQLPLRAGTGDLALGNTVPLQALESYGIAPDSKFTTNTLGEQRSGREQTIILPAPACLRVLNPKSPRELPQSCESLLQVSRGLPLDEPEPARTYCLPRPWFGLLGPDSAVSEEHRIQDQGDDQESDP
jgi:hypothetical protein